MNLLNKLPISVGLSKKIIAFIQKVIYKDKIFNSFEPMKDPINAVKENGHYMVTEIKYGDKYMNSYLDITYPSSDISIKRPTVFYTHGGGFFAGSKTMGDPMAVGDDSNFMFEDIVNEGFNFVNVDYVLTPKGHFPDQLNQLTDAIDYCLKHQEEYGLDMSNVVVMGSSAGAILTGQYGALLANEEYRDAINIYPKIKSEYIKCLVIDDAPFITQNFNWRLKIMMGNFWGTTDLKSEKAITFNAYNYFNKNMKPCFFDAGPKDGFPIDMKKCSDRLTELGVENELFIPKNKELPHGFINLARTDEEARNAEKSLIEFIKRYTK